MFNRLLFSKDSRVWVLLSWFTTLVEKCYAFMETKKWFVKPLFPMIKVSSADFVFVQFCDYNKETKISTRQSMQ